MSTEFHEIEGQIRYLTTEEGGRSSGVYSGYRGQFFYDGEDFDGFQYFPDLSDETVVLLGKPVRVLIRFRLKMWKEVHANKIYVGMTFLVREGRKTVGRGVVTRL